MLGLDSLAIETKPRADRTCAGSGKRKYVTSRSRESTAISSASVVYTQPL